MDQPCCLLSDGTCNVCKLEVDDNEIIQCYRCKNNFHALCGKSGDKICNKSLLVLYLQKSTKRNFVWYCDSCLTTTEITNTDSQSYYNQKVDVLEGKIDLLAAQLNSITDVITPKDVTGDVISDNNAFLNANQKAKSNTIWGNVSKVTILKNNLESAKLNELEKRVMKDEIQITHAKRTPNGDVVITCPTSSAANQVKDIALEVLPNHSVKEPLVNYSWINVVGFEVNHTTSDVFDMLVKNNTVFDCLKQKTPDEAKEFLEVKLVKPCLKNPSVFRALLKVSKALRKVIKLGKDKLRVGLFSCTVYDQSPQIKRCNRCQNFGHWVGNCEASNGKACAKCASLDHETIHCSIDRNDFNRISCINCSRQGIVNIHPRHTADSSTCPCFINHKNQTHNNSRARQTGISIYHHGVPPYPQSGNYQQSGNFQPVVPVNVNVPQSFHSGAPLYNQTFPVNQSCHSNVYGNSSQYAQNNAISSVSGVHSLSHSSQGHLNS